MALIFWVCAAVVAYTYAGYHLILRLLALLIPGRRAARRGGEDRETLRPLPSVAVIVAVYNEERVIQQRIENLLGVEYPPERLEVIVASDGSTDRTVDLAERYADRGVRVLALPRRGKALAQNDAVAASGAEVVVFTDADSEFDPGFLRAVVRPLMDDRRVGCVVGNLSWKPNPTAAFRVKELYWSLEADLRTLESRLGILAGGTGAGMAVRRDLWRPMRDALDDSDSVTPLDVILQGYRVALAEDARVYDQPFSSAESEYRAKVRGVSKTTIMILRRWPGWAWSRHPIISWRLVSHHFLRWMGPFFMAGLMLATAVLARRRGIYAAAAAVEAAVLALGLVGYLGERAGRRVPVASAMWNILAIHAGMAVGVVLAMGRAAKGPWETE
jgi:glycosyltransferase involved in cell wall biosynthesis